MWQRWVPRSLCAEAGIIDPTIQNSAAYIAGWLKYVKSDPKALIIAGAQAQKASDFILGWAGVEQVEAPAELRRRRPDTTRGNVPVHFSRVDRGTDPKPVRSLLNGMRATC